MRVRTLAVVLVGIGLVPAQIAAQQWGAAATPAVVFHAAQQSQAPTPPTLPPSPTPNMNPGSAGPIDQFQADAETYAPRYDRLQSRRHQRSRAGSGYGFYGYGAVIDSYETSRRTGRPYDQRADADVEETGYLRLQIEPASAQVFVDGLYVGIAEQFGSPGGSALEIGPHRIEIRADGFETATFDVRLLPNELKTYRRDLLRVKEPAPARAANPQTFYVIPRCYAGSTPPRAEQLPNGCRVANMREVPPLVSSATRAR